MAAVAASLRFRHGLEACLYFALTPPEGVDGTSKVFLSADVSGCKMEESKTSTMRPYYLIVLEGFHGRLIIVGKLMQNLVTSYCRGAVFPAHEFIIRSDATDACTFHLVRAHAPVGEAPIHYVLRTKSPEARPILEDALRAAMLLSDAARKPEPSKVRQFAVRKAEFSTPLGSTAAAIEGSAAKAAPTAASRAGVRSSAVGAGLTAEERLRQLEERARRALGAQASGGGSSAAATSTERGGRLNVDALPAMPPRSDDFDGGEGDGARRRYAVYAELLETEKAHVRSLQLVAINIMGALLADQPSSHSGPDGPAAAARASVPSLPSTVASAGAASVPAAPPTASGNLAHAATQGPPAPARALVPSTGPGTAAAPAAASLAPILEQSLVQGIFGNIWVLLEVSAELLSLLSDGFATPGRRFSACVAESFKHVLPFFKLTTEYAIGYSARIATLNAEKAANARFATFLQFWALQPQCHGQPLESLLIKPVQRLMRYPLLLEAALKAMPAEHPERALLAEALDSVVRIVAEVNLRMAHGDKHSKMRAVLDMAGVGAELLQPSRRLVLDVHSACVRVAAGGPTVPDARLFLFSDLLLVCQPLSSSYRVPPAGALGAPHSMVEGVTLPGDAVLPGAEERWRYRVAVSIDLSEAYLPGQLLAAATADAAATAASAAAAAHDRDAVDVEESDAVTPPPAAAIGPPSAVAAASDEASATPLPKSVLAPGGVPAPVTLRWFEVVHKSGLADPVSKVSSVSIECRCESARDALQRALHEAVTASVAAKKALKERRLTMDANPEAKGKARKWYVGAVVQSEEAKAGSGAPSGLGLISQRYKTPMAGLGAGGGSSAAAAPATALPDLSARTAEVQ